MTACRSLPLLVTAGLVLAACSAAPGQGPVTLSEDAGLAFGRYLESSKDKAFAVSEYGLAHGFVRCALDSCGSGALGREAAHNCDAQRRRQGTSGRPCRVFAVGNDVVWDGAVTLPDTSAAYHLNVANGAKHRGPAESLGAVIYIPGNGDEDLPPDHAAVPVYVQAMQHIGWDTFKAVTSNAELDLGRSHERAVEGVAQHIATLRAQGYKRVVTAAQSFGSWVSLVGGANPDIWADASIASVPACCGPRVWDGLPNYQFLKNRSELVPVLGALKTPTIVIFFDGDDDFDPGGRGEVAKTALAANGIPHYVIDEPEGLSGHSAAWTREFYERFGGCVIDFAAGDVDSTACAAMQLADR